MVLHWIALWQVWFLLVPSLFFCVTSWAKVHLRPDKREADRTMMNPFVLNCVEWNVNINNPPAINRTTTTRTSLWKKQPNVTNQCTYKDNNCSGQKCINIQYSDLQPWCSLRICSKNVLQGASRQKYICLLFWKNRGDALKNASLTEIKIFLLDFSAS